MAIEESLRAENIKIRILAHRVILTVSMRVNKDNGQERAAFLIDRGWTPIPFTPNGAPIGTVANNSHPHQKWNKGEFNSKITDRALKIELREDTMNLANFLKGNEQGH